MMTRISRTTGDGFPSRGKVVEIAGFSLLIVGFLTSVARVDGDQLIPASCLASALMLSVLVASRAHWNLIALVVGGIAGALGVFLAAKSVAIFLRHFPDMSVPGGIIQLPRVLIGSLIFGVEGAVVGIAVGSLSRTSKQLRLPFSVVIFVVWGLFFTAYVYWLY